MIVGSWGWEN